MGRDEVAVDEGAVVGSVAGAVAVAVAVVVDGAAVAVEGSVGAEPVGDRAAAMAAAAAGLEAMAWSSSGDSVDGLVVLSTGVVCLLYTSPSPRDRQKSRMPSSA